MHSEADRARLYLNRTKFGQHEHKIRWGSLPAQKIDYGACEGGLAAAGEGVEDFSE